MRPGSASAQYEWSFASELCARRTPIQNRAEGGSIQTIILAVRGAPCPCRFAWFCDNSTRVARILTDNVEWGGRTFLTVSLVCNTRPRSNALFVNGKVNLEGSALNATGKSSLPACAREVPWVPESSTSDQIAQEIKNERDRRISF